MLTQKAEAYKYEAKLRMNRYRDLHPIKTPVELTIRLYRPRKAGDIDGPLKILLDALIGYVYIDDAQVVALHVYRLDDKDNPRVEIDVEQPKVIA